MRQPPTITPARAWEPLSDREWDALAPWFFRTRCGRPIRDPRGRLDAIFAHVTTRRPWREAGRGAHSAAATERQFRRWAHAGVWERLFDIASAPDASLTWRGLRAWLYAAFRRGHRLLPLSALLRAKRLGLWSALPAPPWFLPDPDLSERLQRLVLLEVSAPVGRDRALYRLLARCLRGAAGRPIPRRLCWPPA
jgi:transposase